MKMSEFFFWRKKVKELQVDKNINIKLMETINGLVNIQKDSNENLQKNATRYLASNRQL